MKSFTVDAAALDIMAEKMGVTSEAYAAKRGAPTPMQRCGQTAEVSHAVLFLASAMASFICGTHQCCRVCRNIASVTPKISHFGH